jgi:predicted choloylglycine hydrolase
MMGKPEDDLQLEKQADYRTFTLSGSHYEMGRQWGMIARAEEVDSLTPAEAAETAQLLGVSLDSYTTLDVAPEAAKDEEPALSPSQLSFAEECLQVVCNFHPPLLDELEGWCQALGVSMDSALGMLSFGMEESARSCSAFACQTKDGVVVGRNYDFFHWAHARHLIQARPDIYYATVGMNDGLLGGRDEGVNEKGLFVALNRAIARAPTKVRPGVIFHLVPRILLETCATAGEAGMLAREMPHLMSHCYLIADPQKMLVVEAHPDVVRVREPEDGYIAVTNHYLYPDLQALMESPNQENSELRLRSILKGLEEADRDYAFWGTAQAILKDHETPLCVHTDELATLWSMVANLTDQRVAYSLGAPCRNAFEKVPWPGTPHILPSEENT